MNFNNLRLEFWKWGHDLYQSSASTFPATFVPGDLFNGRTLSPGAVSYSPPSTPKPTDLPSLTSLNPLKGHISVIHSSLFFHLFNEDEQLDLARRAATLLSHEKGSVIFGSHYGRPKKGTRTEILAAGPWRTQFWHSPQSWKKVWEDQVFRKGSVKVEVEWEVSTEYENMEGPNKPAFYYMTWCITRL